MRQGYNFFGVFHELKVVLPSQMQPIIFDQWDKEPALKELRIAQTADPAVNPTDRKIKAPTVTEMIQNSRQMGVDIPGMESFTVPNAGFFCPFVPRG